MVIYCVSESEQYNLTVNKFLGEISDDQHKMLRIYKNFTSGSGFVINFIFKSTHFKITCVSKLCNAISKCNLHSVECFFFCNCEIVLSKNALVQFFRIFFTQL